MNYRGQLIICKKSIDTLKAFDEATIGRVLMIMFRECAGEDDVRIGAVRIELYGLKYAFVVTELKNRVAGLLGVGCEVKIIE